MAAIVILEHRLQRHVQLPYLVYQLASRWKAAGHAVSIHYGTDDPPPADLAILNVDLTVVPAAYLALANRYPHSINGGVADISKRAFSAQLLSRDSAWAGPVIVKTDANYGGRGEQGLRVIAQRRSIPCDIPAAPIVGDYPVYSAAREVPDAVWSKRDFVVEKFLPEQDERGYYIRHWIFFGEAGRNTRCRALSPIIKSADIVEREELPVPDEVRAWRDRMGFDLGKFDYVVRDGQPVLIDINRTPTASQRPDQGTVSMLDRMATAVGKWLG
jgi:hypothetical protein